MMSEPSLQNTTNGMTIGIGSSMAVELLLTSVMRYMTLRVMGIGTSTSLDVMIIKNSLPDTISMGKNCGCKLLEVNVIRLNWLLMQAEMPTSQEHIQKMDNQLQSGIQYLNIHTTKAILWLTSILVEIGFGLMTVIIYAVHLEVMPYTVHSHMVRTHTLVAYSAALRQK